MDWNAAIERHRTALKRVLVTLAALAGLTLGESPPLRGRCPAGQRGVPGSTVDNPPLSAPPTSPPQGGRIAGITLPRHLHRAVLRLLRPAEAAVRRLIIVAARDIETPPSSLRHGERVSSRFAGGVVPVARWKASERRDGAEHRGPGRQAGDGGMAPAYPARIALPLFDPPRCLLHKRLRASATDMPRISIPGWSEPAPLPVPPAPDDDIDARRLTLRLAAIARVLDDLPREARRFARWRASRDAVRTQNQEHAEGIKNGEDRAATGAQGKETAAGAQYGADAARLAGRLRRIWPLRPGRPPGQRPASGRRPAHPVHQILEDIHGLAFWVLEAPDTS